MLEFILGDKSIFVRIKKRENFRVGIYHFIGTQLVVKIDVHLVKVVNITCERACVCVGGGESQSQNVLIVQVLITHFEELP